MKKIAYRALSIFVLMSVLLSSIAFAEAASYTVSLYKNGALAGTYNVNAGGEQTLERGTVESGRYLKGWMTQDGTRLYGYRIIPEDDTDLYAQYGDCTTPAPGINMIANSSMDDDYFEVYPADGVISYETEDTNRIIRYKRNNKYAAIQRYVKWEAKTTKC